MSFSKGNLDQKFLFFSLKLHFLCECHQTKHKLYCSELTSLQGPLFLNYARSHNCDCNIKDFVVSPTASQLQCRPYQLHFPAIQRFAV